MIALHKCPDIQCDGFIFSISHSVDFTDRDYGFRRYQCSHGHFVEERFKLAEPGILTAADQGIKIIGRDT